MDALDAGHERGVDEREGNHCCLGCSIGGFTPSIMDLGIRVSAGDAMGLREAVVKIWGQGEQVKMGIQ